MESKEGETLSFEEAVHSINSEMTELTNILSACQWVKDKCIEYKEPKVLKKLTVEHKVYKTYHYACVFKGPKKLKLHKRCAIFGGQRYHKSNHMISKPCHQCMKYFTVREGMHQRRNGSYVTNTRYTAYDCTDPEYKKLREEFLKEIGLESRHWYDC